MLLAIDARNRTVTLGFGTGYSWLLVRRFGASSERTADEYALLMGAAADEAARLAALRSRGEGAARESAARTSVAEGAVAGTVAATENLVTSAWISSVVPALTPSLVEAVRERFGLAPGVVGPGTRTGVKIRTDFPSEVGSDLVCASAAAHELVDGPCLIVDLGAVLTVSAVTSQGEFVGCAIAPGLRTAADSLKSVAAQLPEVRLEVPARAIGRSTAQSVQSGVVLGYEGLVRGLVERMGAELRGPDPGPAVELIGSGEASTRGFLSSCGIERFEPELVLAGLALIAKRNG
jgi:type III pantothenate kinase